MKKVFFVLEKCLVDRDESDDWENKLKEANVEYAIVKRVPFAKTLKEAFPDGLPKQITKRYEEEYYNPEYGDQCFQPIHYIPVYYCTIEMCRLLKDNVNELNLKGLFYTAEDEMKCSNYYPKMDSNIPMLNEDHVYISFKNLIKEWSTIFTGFGNNSTIFIRPNGGDKDFTGRIVDYDEKDEFIDECTKYSDIEHGIKFDDRILCLVSSPKPIVAEYRFFILNKEVICGSQYRRNNILDKRMDVMPGAEEIANLVAKQDYQPDLFYCVDICELSNNEFKVIEMNSGSCSGIYECNKSLLISAFTKFFEV